MDPPAPPRERTDAELLADFARERSESALRALVDRHVGPVHRTCLRLLKGDVARADDAAQAVFIVLAEKAAGIRNPEALGAWLFRTAALVVENSRRAEARRRRHEREAAALRTEEKTEPALGEEAKAALYEALAELKPALQAAVVLHFLEGKPREEAAREAGCSLEAFHKRLGSALENLRGRLAGRGVAFSVEALAAGLSVEAAAAVPASLSAACQAAAGAGLAGGAVDNIQAAVLAKGALKTMFWTQAKYAAASAAAVVLLSAAILARAGEPRIAPPAPPVVEKATKDGPTPHGPTEALPAPVRVLGKADFQAPRKIYSVGFSADSRMVAGACQGEVVVWDIETRKQINRIPMSGYTYALKFLSDRRRLLALVDGDSRMGPRTVALLWDLKADREIRRFVYQDKSKSLEGEHHNFSRSFEVSPDEHLLCLSGSSNQRCDILAWDLNSGERIEGIQNATRPWTANHYSVDALAFSPDAKRLATYDSWCGASGRIRQTPQDNTPRFAIWAWEQKQAEHTWSLPVGLTNGHPDTVRWLPDGRRLLLPHVWRNKTAITLVVKANDGKIETEFPGVSALLNDGRTLVRYSGGFVHFHDLEAGKETGLFQCAKVELPSGPAVSPDGRWFACGIHGNSLLLIDLKERKSLAPGGGHWRQPRLVYTADGRLLVCDSALTRAHEDSMGMRTSEFAAYISGEEMLCAEGRKLLSSGSDGVPELWDTVQGVRLGLLTKHGGGYVEHAIASGDGCWALTTGMYDGALQFHDLRTGKPLAKLKGPEHPFFKGKINLARCCWTERGDRAFLCESSAGWFQDHDLKQAGLTRPIGLNGAFDPRTGTRVFWYKNREGQPIENSLDLDLFEKHDLIYLLSDPAGKRPGLWKASDGTFLRDVEHPGRGARFTPDGKRLIGPDATVDVETGKTLARFEGGALRVPSPSGSLVARLDDSAVLRFYDGRTGAEFWRAVFDSPEAPRPVAETLSWHPGEGQVALVLKDSTLVLQVELFPKLASLNPPPQREQLAEWIGHFESQDPAERECGVRGLVAAGKAGAEEVALRIQSGGLEHHTLRVAVFALEWMAREENAEARKRLEKMGAGKAGDHGTLFAQDALARLNALQKSRDLRKAHANAAPLVWPAPTAEETKDEF